MNKVTGCLAEKRGKWYMVVYYYDEHNERKSSWKSTGLAAKRNNKKQANVLLDERIHEFRTAYNLSVVEKLYFEELLETWMNVIKSSVRENTFETYKMQMEKHILSYFKKKHILLKDLRPKDINAYYQYELKRGMSSNTVKKYHANIHKALKYAVREELIPSNPSDCLELPKTEKYEAGFYTLSEAEELFKVVEGTKMEVPVKLAVMFGFRREEVLGLRWSAIDLKKGTLTVNSTCILVGTKAKNVKKTKNESSTRTLYLNDDMIQFFKNVRHKENEKKMRLGADYINSGYVCVDEKGQQLKPNYISQTFARILRKNNLRKIRFHDLRHTCASILINQGFQLKDIQDWLGHSNIQTTANIYGHLDDERKRMMADKMTGLIVV